jgi:hypothetical protein
LPAHFGLRTFSGLASISRDQDFQTPCHLLKGLS